MIFFKKIIILVSLYITNLNLLFADGKDTIKDGLLGNPDSDTIIIGGVKTISQGDLSVVDKIFNFFQDSISGLILIVALGVFLFIGIKLVVARGNPEEFKKSIMQFVYAAIGFFIVSASWAIVKLVAGLNI